MAKGKRRCYCCNAVVPIGQGQHVSVGYEWGFYQPTRLYCSPCATKKGVKK